jgi:hypothetical protein
MTTTLSINKDPLYTVPPGIQAKLHINGKQNKWFFMSGTPTHPNKVNLLGVGINSYLMFGNDIEIPQGFMQETQAGFASIGFGLPTFTDNATGQNNYQSAKGFALGIGVNYHKADSWNILAFHGPACDCDRYLNINYVLDAGGEIDASLLQYAGCTGFGDGWRAKTSIALYAGAKIFYDYNLPFLDPASGFLASVAVGVNATAEFPNPTYFEGQLDGNFEVEGYAVPFHKHFLSGNQCAGSVVELDPAINQNVYTQESITDSMSYSLIKDILEPLGTTGVSRTKGFSVLLNYPYNEAFDLQEQQASGEMKVRTFRANYTVILTQDSASSNSQSSGNVTNNLNASSNTAIQPGSKNKSTIANLSGNAGKTQSTNINPLALKDGGIDMMGAKKFTLLALANASPNSIASKALKANTSYRFVIKAALQEKINNNWVPVKNKSNNQPIKETKIAYFKTNSDAVGLPGNATSTGTNQMEL